MKQIKTIKNRLDNAEEFDAEVNAALVEGWTLTRRDVIRPNAHPVGETSFTMLYAELELDIEKRCDNCKHAEIRATNILASGRRRKNETVFHAGAAHLYGDGK